jgi:phosphatidate phosphatase APP1
VLIGDSGEKDGDIYIEVAKKYPSQIKAIYLRSVNDEKRIERVTKLFNEFREVPFLLFKETGDAIIHAQEHGFI